LLTQYAFQALISCGWLMVSVFDIWDGDLGVLPFSPVKSIFLAVGSVRRKPGGIASGPKKD